MFRDTENRGQRVLSDFALGLLNRIGTLWLFLSSHVFNVAQSCYANMFPNILMTCLQIIEMLVCDNPLCL